MTFYNLYNKLLKCDHHFYFKLASFQNINYVKKKMKKTWKYFNVRNFRGEKISRSVPYREIFCFHGNLISSRLGSKYIFRGNLIWRLKSKSSCNLFFYTGKNKKHIPYRYICLIFVLFPTIMSQTTISDI